MKKIISSFAVLFVAQVSQAAIFQLNPNGIPTQNSERVQSFLNEVEAKLPALMKSKFVNQKIIVQFAQLDKENTVVIPKDCANVVDSIVEAKGVKAQFDKAADKRQIRYNQQIQSITNKNTITLNSNFLSVIAAGESKAQGYACDHKNTYRLAQGSLINGAARVYDGLTKNSVSGNLQYRFIAGWNAKKLMQSFWPRAVNPYEYAGTPADHFAYNLEFYLLDPEYACRRPLLQKYLSQHTGQANLTRNCEINTELPLPKENVHKVVDKTGKIDETYFTDLAVYDLNPDQVYNVYYMKASSGQGIGGFGHSMFRVVVCPPNMSVSKQCDKILDNDLVFNPRANPNEMRLDNLKGLFGGYPSQFLVNSVYDLHAEYGDNELRHLFNMPLGQKNASGQFEEVMTKEQKEKFIYAALESYWAYYGNYKFISNNCADEALRLYQMTSTDPAVLKLGVLKPNDINKKLSNLGYLDDTEVKTYEKTPGIIAKLFGAGKIKNQREYDERRSAIEAASYKNAFISRIYTTEDAIIEIMKLEGALNTNFKVAKKEIKKWLSISTPDYEWSDEDAPVGAAQMTEEQKKEVLKNTFYQIQGRYENLMAKAKTQKEKELVIFYFYRVMYYIYNKRAEQVGNNAVQIAYSVAYPSKDRKVKASTKDTPLTQEQADTIRTALDKYSATQAELMPYREASVKMGYGIPLKSDVVRGEKYLGLKESENQNVKDVIESLGSLLGPEQILLHEIGKFHDKLKSLRLSYEEK